MARVRSQFRNSLEYLSARTVLAVLAHSPRPIAERVARFCAWLLDAAIPRLRRTAMRNLEFAMPELDDRARRRIVDGAFRSIARVLVAFAHFPKLKRGDLARWIRYDGLEHFNQAKRRGRGVLFATAHMGNWELSAFAHGILTEPMHVIVRPLDNPRIDALVERYRTLGGNRVIQKKDSARGILKALSLNRAVGILVDQNATPDNGVFVDFFGVLACASTGLAKLAAHSGASVIPGFALWSDADRRYVLRFYPPLEMTGDPVEDTARIQRQLEAVIREYPDQWLWIHRRWKTRPPGGPPI